MKKVIIYVLGIALALYLTSWITGTSYIWKTLAYNYVDYDDYKIFENRTIRAGAPQPWPMAEESKKVAISSELDALLTELGTISFLAIKDQEVIYEKYWDGYDESTLVNSFSMAKSYVGALIGVALTEGKIKDLDQPITDYLTNLEGDHFKNITIRNLLTMTSGLKWVERYNMPINHTSESYYGTDLWSLVKDLDFLNEPGKIWHYKGSDPQLLAFVLKAATGQTPSDYLSEKVWIPTGATSDALWSLDHKGGDEKAYCCINTHARNFARLGQLYMDHGKWNGKAIIDSAYIWQSLQSVKTPNADGKPTLHYGYQWWTMADLGKNIFYCRGLNGQYIFVFPDQDLVVVRLGNQRKKGDGNHPIEVLEIVKWVESLSAA